MVACKFGNFEPHNSLCKEIHISAVFESGQQLCAESDLDMILVCDPSLTPLSFFHQYTTQNAKHTPTAGVTGGIVNCQVSMDNQPWTVCAKLHCKETGS